MFTPGKSWMAAAGALLGLVCGQAEPDSGLSVKLEVGGPAMKGVSYRFVDEHTGTRTGVLSIGSVTMEYRRQGFMHVAWRPLVVLSKVDLQTESGAAWPAQLGHALAELGGRDELVMRDVHLHLAGTPAREVSAATARFLPGGVLELSDATLAAPGTEPGSAPGGTFRLWLAGPRAGRLFPANVPAAGLADATSIPTKTNLAQSER
ncbi:MAG TPA: hypothetical protein VHD61_03965 [Lacunisphaera sp.]|nr:hypothetical protein [Lacunisphaera sp.]